MRLNLAIVAIVMVLTVWATHALQTAPPSKNITVVDGRRNIAAIENAPAAPAFSFTGIDGRVHDIADFKGKTVILNFWATWCAPCVAEFPKLLQLAARDGVVLIALSVDEDKSKIAPFLKRLDQAALKRTNIVIARDPDRKIVQDLFQSYMLPETILIDPQQRLREKIAGADWDYDSVAKIVDGLAAP